MKRITALILSGTFLTVFAIGGAFAQTDTPAQSQTPGATEARPSPMAATPSGSRWTQMMTVP